MKVPKYYKQLLTTDAELGIWIRPLGRSVPARFVDMRGDDETDVLVLQHTSGEVIHVAWDECFAITELPHGRFEQLADEHATEQRARRIQLAQLKEQLAGAGGRNIVPAVGAPPPGFNPFGGGPR